MKKFALIIAAAATVCFAGSAFAAGTNQDCDHPLADGDNLGEIVQIFRDFPGLPSGQGVGQTLSEFVVANNQLKPREGPPDGEPNGPSDKFVAVWNGEGDAVQFVLGLCNFGNPHINIDIPE